MNFSFFYQTLRLAITNLGLHKLRSALTSLGIIIGVGAVITMLALGEGAKRKTIREVEQLGATNIILRSIAPPESNNATSSNTRMLIYGLKRVDLEQIQSLAKDGILPRIEEIVPLRDAEGQEVIRGAVKASGAAPIATTANFLKVANLRMAQGRFLTDADSAEVKKVCVLGAVSAQQLFGPQSPIGQDIKIGSHVFTVVGVTEPDGLAGGKGSALVGRDLNLDIYFPLTTNASVFGDMISKRTSGSRELKQIELSEIYIRMYNASDVEPTAAALIRMMQVNHAEKRDVQTIVPRELLNQANQAAFLWSVVMGCIAGLSLLIGGIGIMNISLATVTERTREIGVRRALGARRIHIVAQFLVETTTLSVAGGLLGIVMGIGLAVGIQLLVGDNFPTAVTWWPVVLSFTISAAVGIGFGVYPAYVAAHKDPIEALRHD